MCYLTLVYGATTGRDAQFTYKPSLSNAGSLAIFNAVIGCFAAPSIFLAVNGPLMFCTVTIPSPLSSVHSCHSVSLSECPHAPLITPPLPGALFS